METRLPLLQPNMETELEPVKRLDFWTVSARLTCIVAEADAITEGDAATGGADGLMKERRVKSI